MTRLPDAADARIHYDILRLRARAWCVVTDYGIARGTGRRAGWWCEDATGGYGTSSASADAAARACARPVTYPTRTAALDAAEGLGAARCAARIFGRKGGLANSRAQQAQRRQPKPGAGRPAYALPEPRIIEVARGRAFAHAAEGYRAKVEIDGRVAVWDERAAQYTCTHALTPRQVAYVRQLARRGA